MALTPQDALNAVRDIANNSVEKASDIVEDASHIIKGDVAGGTSAIVQDSIAIGTYAVDRIKEALTGDDEYAEPEDGED